MSNLSNIMNEYTALLETHTVALQKVNQRYNVTSAFRLALVLGIIYCLYRFAATYEPTYMMTATALAVFFLVLLKYHARLREKKQLEQALTDINQAEIDYLNNDNRYDDGIGFSDATHPNAYDLDVFGKNGLFHHINRTGTYIGKQYLAGLLSSLLPKADILKNQESIQELSGKLNWRQQLLALTMVHPDNKSAYDQTIAWSQRPSEPLPTVVKVLSYAMPLILVAAIIGYWITGDASYSKVIKLMFSLNLTLVFSQIKRIRQETMQADRIHLVLKQYGLIFKHIETEAFESSKLKQLQAQLKYQNHHASTGITQLSALFDRMDSINNLMGAILFNGFFMYHLQVLQSLVAWKTAHGKALENWLRTIGEIEALNSVANFRYNNPSFIFPEISDQSDIRFQQLGHPLIKAEKRVCNDVAFDQQRFIVLTGSNMSGKSTFLRTLGINMLLSGIGAPICATHARVRPLPIFVSMRLSDSLNDSESYFYAEVKRLQTIMEHLEKAEYFVLLDEILRGTNSDDKRQGTVEVIKKMIQKKAIGAIATHDIEVCKTSDEYPNYLSNKCFEVELKDNGLLFDYRLRDGVCQNKSASFIMKQMGVI